ncbi:uncharacterized protein LOC119387672 [Rhipicephalus sanguineus]|uniref:uncharacterized protein LOC119387672 n=1 Tax=Rhipicephalus sanguineus TaxID=34632 RepID=UPI00189315B4|nr:uncharacterized protein LOC119387672 [Rhipicephalus sanguineus]
MKPSAGPSRPLLPKPANVGQGTLRNDNPPMQSNDGVLRFSLTLTPEHFPDSHQPASTNGIVTAESFINSRGNDFERVRYTRHTIGSLRCRFCESVWPSKRSLLLHLQKHSRDASRQTDILLEKLVSSLSALGYGMNDPPSATPYGQNRAANVTLEQTQAHQWPRTRRSFPGPGQTEQQTQMTSSSNNFSVPPGNSSSSIKLNNYAQKAYQTGQRLIAGDHGRVVMSPSSAGPSSQNPTIFGVESCSTALNNEWANQRPAQQATALNPTLGDNVRGTSLNNSIGRGESSPQSQPVTPNKRPSQAELRASDSKRSIERLAVAQAILSPLQYIFLSANDAPAVFSGSDVIRPSAEDVPSIEGTTPGVNNIANNQLLPYGAPTSPLGVKRQDVSPLWKKSALRISGTEPSQPEKSLTNSPKLTKDADRGNCASNSEQRPSHDEVTSTPLLTSCTESRWRETSNTGSFSRTGRESSYGGVIVTDISANQSQGDWRTACEEDTTKEGSSAQQGEPVVQTDSTTENPPALPFALKPVLDLEVLEQVVKQEEDAVPVSCHLDVAEEESPDGLGNKNVDELSSAQCVAGPASGGDVVINESPDPASGGDPVANESPGHLSKDHIPNNAELPPSTPNAVHGKAVQHKRGFSCDHVANGAKAAQRSKHFHGSSLDKAKARIAPASITESDNGPGTSQPKRIRAVTWHPPQYDHNDNGAPPPNAAKGAARQKLAQAPPSSEDNEEAPKSALGGGTSKTWQCPSCSKVLSCKSSLDRHHQLVHEGLRPMKCPHCTKSFGLNDSLQIHIRGVHTGERPFGCHLCPNAFSNSASLHRHLMWHNNVRKFACHLCPGKFVIKEHLERHVRSHTRERPFACPLCPRRLATSYALKRHRLAHLDEWPHQCEVCGKKFRELRTLRNHTHSKHPTEISFE